MPNIRGFLSNVPENETGLTPEQMLDLLQPHSGHNTTRVSTRQGGVASDSLNYAVSCSAKEIDDCLIAYEGRLYWDASTPLDIQAASDLAAGLVMAYRQLGPGLLQYLRGSYAIAILLPKHRRALLAIDRIGIRPLAYGVTEKGLVFASSTLAVSRFPGIDNTLSPQAIYDYLFFHVIPSPETIFGGVAKLPPAHFAHYDNGQLTLERYWFPDFDPRDTAEDTLAVHLRDQIEQAMDRQFETPTAPMTGAFLSGGLDSSTVVGLLAERSATTVAAYTIGFDAEGYDEIPYARQSASHYGSNLHEYYVTPEDVAEAIAIIANGYDEPFGNASAIPAYFCAQMAFNDGRTILMAGDGGDELFGGNERYLTQKIFSIFETTPSFVQHLLKSAFLSNTLGDSLPPLRKLRSYIRQAAVPLPQRLNTYNFLRRTPTEEIFEPDFLAQIDITRPEREQREVFHLPEHADTLQRLLFLDWKYTLADNDLRKVNRACELAGIEVRYPLLDDKLIDFSTTIPSSLMIRGNSLRDFYKRALADFLPPHTISKKKHGFGLPFGVWMAREPRLNALAIDSLEGMKRRNIFKPSYIDRLIQAQRSEHAAYYGVMIWVIVMLEQWLRIHHR